VTSEDAIEPLLIALCYDAREPYVASNRSEEAACCFHRMLLGHIVESALARRARHRLVARG
jgi:hypothetical protein